MLDPGPDSLAKSVALRGRPMRSTLLRAAVAAIAFGCLAGPAHAYRVFLDHDRDDDLGTFENLVDGSLTVPISIVVALDPEDAALGYLPFSISWDCRSGPSDTHLIGQVEWLDPLPVSGPFEDPAMTSCHMLNCDCMATRVFGSPVAPRTPGNYRFAVLSFTRDPAYGTVQFRVGCEGCSYRSEDLPKTTMTLTTSVIVDSASWGRVKSIYR